MEQINKAVNRPILHSGTSSGARIGAKFWSALVIVNLGLLLPTSCFSEIIEAKWWSNKTASSNIIVYPDEAVRLGNARSGQIEGMLVLPSGNQWTVRFSVNADESPARSTNDSVKVFLGGVQLGEYRNDPAMAGYGIAYRFNGGQLPYRFEFKSQNSVLGSHQSVSPGLITSESVRVAGNVDAFGLPAEPASPSIWLAQILVTQGIGRLDFDEVPGRIGVPANRTFGQTFTDIPSDVESAVVWVRVRGGVGNPETDVIDILFSDTQHPTLNEAKAWERNLGAYLSDPGLIKNTAWIDGDVAVVKLDLAALPLVDGGTTNLLQTIRDKGFLDVLVADDSGVDYVLLDIQSKPRTLNSFAFHTAVELDVQTELGKKYQIQGSQDLNTWSDFGDPFAGDGARFFKLISTRGSKYRFFRVAVR